MTTKKATAKKRSKIEGFEVRMAPISRVQRYSRNPRVNSQAVAKVVSSIREFGWQQPIVVDKSFTIIAGDTRYLAALEIGDKRVPVHVATNLTPAQVRAYRIADNKVAEASTWDPDRLSAELKAIDEMVAKAVSKGAAEAALDSTGFDAKEREKIGRSLAAGVERRSREKSGGAQATENWVAKMLGVPDPTTGKNGVELDQVAHFFGADTALKRSSAPLRFWRREGYLKGDVLDYGCGHEEHDFARWDPFTAPDLDALQRRYDVVMCNHVLNVQPADHLVTQVLLTVRSLIRPSGRALFAVLTDRKLNGTAALGHRNARTRTTWAATLEPFFEVEDVTPRGFCGFVCRPRQIG